MEKKGIIMKEIKNCESLASGLMHVSGKKLAKLSNLQNELGSYAREEVLFRLDAQVRRALGESSEQAIFKRSNSEKELESQPREEELFREDYKMRVAFGGRFDVGSCNPLRDLKGGDT